MLFEAQILDDIYDMATSRLGETSVQTMKLTHLDMTSTSRVGETSVQQTMTLTHLDMTSSNNFGQTLMSKIWV